MTVTPDATLLERNRFDESASACLVLAVGLAQATGHQQVRSAHILLAVLKKDVDRIDPACRALLDGLKASTLADSIRDQLLIDADEGGGGDLSIDPLQLSEFDETAASLLKRAHAYATSWGVRRVPLLALTCSACEAPDGSISEVLRVNRIQSSALAGVGAHVLRHAGPSSDTENAIEIFDGDVLNLDAFEPVLKGALRSLGPVVTERPLLDADLLAALASNPRSRLARALLDAQVSLETARARLAELASAVRVLPGAADAPITRARIGRLLSRMLVQAVDLAREDGSDVILESHLLLAHLDRIGEAQGNLYHRLGLDPARVRAALTKPKVAARDGIQLFDDGGMLAAAAFGPLARAGLKTLAAGAAERILLDSDLIHALVSQPDSRLLDTLHVLGAPVPAFRRALQPFAGSGARLSQGGPVAEAPGAVPKDRIGGLLQAVLAAAAALAVQEGCTVIGESHLVRAHIGRVATSSLNVYERFGVDTRRLSETLRRYPADTGAGPSVAVAPPPGLEVDIEGYLNARVINQVEAVRRAARALKRMRSGLGEPGQVMGKFFFLGATGVGKTELARAMADVAFGVNTTVREAHMIRIDCGAFQDKRDVVQLLGAAQGLVGYKEGQLTNGLREKPRSVILFDEAEKADKAIWQSLLPLFDEGIVREADGTVYDATNCIIVATSNKGYEDAINAFDAWNRSWDEVKVQVEEAVWTAVQRYLSPEFRGRFGRENIIFFNHFKRTDYTRIIELQVGILVDEMKGRGFELTFAEPDKVIAFLTDLAWLSRNEGARPVRRLVTDHVRDQMVAARADDPGRTRFCFAVQAGTGTLALQEL